MLLLLAYTGSGITALSYEVLWARLLGLQFGVSIFGVVVTIAAFMAGLGLGSVWGAYIGGLIVGVVEAFAGYYIDPALKNAIWFIIFLVVLIVRPSGLLGQVGAEEVGFREQN